MNQNTPYRYSANNAGSYNELAAYALGLSVNVSLYPRELTIVIDGEAANAIGEYIDEQGLDFHISPIEIDADNLDEIANDKLTDPGTLRKAIELLRNQIRDMYEGRAKIDAYYRNQQNALKADRDHYAKKWEDAYKSNMRVRSQIKAIAALMSAIYPDEK